MLRGRAFYESIGSPKVVLAPMVDHSEFAWRMLSRSYMPAEDVDAAGQSPLLAYTPMLHARHFGEKETYRHDSFESTRTPAKGQPADARPYLDGNRELDRPLFTQFCANDPDAFLAAAKIVAPYCDAVDLNLGCPQGIAKRGNYGAFLQEQRSLIYQMINKLHNELDVPITAKIRLQATREDTLAYAKMILDAGANVLTVHGRQRHQKGQQTGLADWTAIRHLRDSLPPETVIFANGNILEHSDIAACLEATGADAVMSAEANLYDPTIFAPPPANGTDHPEYWRDVSGRGGWRVDGVLRRYLDITYTHILQCEPPNRRPLFQAGQDIEEHAPQMAVAPIAQAPSSMKRSPNLNFMRAHLYKLLRPLLTKYTDIRDSVNRLRPGDMAAYEALLHDIEVLVAQSLQQYEAGDLGVGDHVKQPQSDAQKRVWRPWWVCQAYVRPEQEEPLNGQAKKKEEQPKYTVGFDPLDMALGIAPEDIPVAG